MFLCYPFSVFVPLKAHYFRSNLIWLLRICLYNRPYKTPANRSQIKGKLWPVLPTKFLIIFLIFDKKIEIANCFVRLVVGNTGPNIAIDFREGALSNPKSSSDPIWMHGICSIYSAASTVCHGMRSLPQRSWSRAVTEMSFIDSYVKTCIFTYF